MGRTYFKKKKKDVKTGGERETGLKEKDSFSPFLSPKPFD